MIKYDEIFDRHEKAVLMCSGGKDSIACLYLMEKWLHKIIVLWVNTGAAFPEVIKLMNDVRHSVPNFLEVKTDQPENIEAFGYPSEILPINYTVTGQLLSGRKPLKIQAYVDCCNRNIWAPSFDAALKTGATLIIRGQRNQEFLKGPLRSGVIADGIEYLYPIEEWTREEVFAYLKERQFKIPDHYALSATSLDCWNCTAYCYEHKDKLAYMEKHHPQWHDEYKDKLTDIRTAIGLEIKPLNYLLEK